VVAADSVEVEEGGVDDRDTSGALPVRCGQCVFVIRMLCLYVYMYICIIDEFCEEKD